MEATTSVSMSRDKDGIKEKNKPTGSLMMTLASNHSHDQLIWVGVCMNGLPVNSMEAVVSTVLSRDKDDSMVTSESTATK